MSHSSLPERSTRRARHLAFAALGAGTVAGLQAAAAYRKRRQLLQNGEIRPLHSQWLDVNGCRMYARISADRATSSNVPVVLVHGWGVSSSYYVPTAERLACAFSVYAVDLPGHGSSEAPSQPLDIGGLAQTLLDWMDIAGIKRAALVGQSMGCEIVTEAAIRDPARVSRLVLIGLTPDPDARSVWKQFTRLVRGGLYEKPSLTYYLLKDYLRMLRRLRPEFWSMVCYPMEEKLPRVNKPIMLVRGQNDPVVPQGWFEEAVGLAGANRTAVIPRWGHAVQYSAAKQLTEAIEPFLREDFAG